MAPARSGRRLSDVTNFDNLVLNDAARRFHGNHVAFFLGNQGASNRRADRDLALLEVSLILTHDLVSHAFVGLDVGDFHGRAENYLAGMRDGGDIDDHRILHTAFDVTNPRLDHTLLLASSVVFGVFLQVTQLAGRTDVLAQLWTYDLGQMGVLLFQGARALNGHRVFGYAHAFNPACRSCKRRTVFSGPNFSASQIASPAAMVVVQ